MQRIIYVLLDDNLLLSDDVNSLGELTNICAQVATIEGEDTCILLLILLDDRAVDTCSKVLEIIEGNDTIGLLDVVERLFQCAIVEFDTQKFGLIFSTWEWIALETFLVLIVCPLFVDLIVVSIAKADRLIRLVYAPNLHTSSVEVFCYSPPPAIWLDILDKKVFVILSIDLVSSSVAGIGI